MKLLRGAAAIGVAERLRQRVDQVVPRDAQIGRSSSAYDTDRRRSTPSLVIVY